MISLSNINKQYGRQLIFVDASFQLNPGRKGRPGRPQRRRQDDAVPDDRRRGSARRGRGHRAAEADRRLLPPGRRGDVGPLGAGRGDCRQRPAGRSAPRAGSPAARDGGSRAGRQDGQGADPLRRGAGRVRAPGRLHARGAGARGAARAGAGGRPDRRRRRRALGRLEDARGAGPRAARQARRPADGRTDQPPGHRVDHLARAVPEVAERRAADDLARPRVHEPHRHQDRGDRQRRDHVVFGRLRLLRARARHPRDQPAGGLCAAAGDAGEGAALHRALQDARGQGVAGAEPHQGARQDREDRAAQEAAGGEVRVPHAAALRRPGGGGREPAQDASASA